MKRFAVSLRITRGHELMDALNHSEVKWCESMGIEPVLIPNCISEPAAYMLRLKVDGLILTGGNDVSGFAEEGTASSEAPMRDKTERLLLACAAQRGLPVLGICRGMQLLNVCFGGDLLCNVRKRWPDAREHVGQVHEIQITDARIRAYLGVSHYSVNSFHLHAITPERVSLSLNTFAVCKSDNIVEGLIHPSLPILGIQWHPERGGSSESHDRRLVLGFLNGFYWT